MLFKAKTITNYLAGIFDYEVTTITLYINLARLSGIALGAKTVREKTVWVVFITRRIQYDILVQYRDYRNI